MITAKFGSFAKFSLWTPHPGPLWYVPLCYIVTITQLPSSSSRNIVRWLLQTSKQASLFAQLISVHNYNIDDSNAQGYRLPEKPIRPNIADRLAKKILNEKNKHIHVHSAGIEIDSN